MATGQDDEFEPSKIIGAISRLAGALVGSAVLAGRRVIISVTTVGRSSSDKLEEKSARAPAKRKKRATPRKKTKGRKAKKKLETAKWKGANPPPKGGTSKKSNGLKKQGPQPEVVEANLHGDKPRGASTSADSAS